MEEGNQPSSPVKTKQNVVKMSYIVDQHSGPYYNIQSAINKAKSGSIIKISSGLYKENLVIKGKSLSLEARDVNSEVYILGSKGPTLLIEDLPYEQRMQTKTSGNRLETFASGSGSDSESNNNLENKLAGNLYNQNLDNSDQSQDEIIVDKNLLHSKTETNPMGSSSHFSESDPDEDYANQVPDHIKGTPDAHKFIRKVNPGLRKTVNEQLKNLKNSMKKINQQLANTHTVNIQGLRLTHKGSINKRFLQTNKGINNDILKDNKVALLANVENYHLQFERVDFSSTTDSVIMIKSGELILKKCLVNLNLLTRESQLITCAVIADSGSTVSIESCEFRGSKYFNTIGVILRNANMLMKNTSVSNFMSGGIIMYTKIENVVKIYKSRIRHNKYFGIQILGNSSSPSIQYCTIEHNACVGIQICTSNKCNIRKNIISLNINGIEIISADPLIYENEINQNYANGIMIKSVENLVAMPKIQGNDIFSNSGNGILCMGMANKTYITKNTITFNKKSGIHIMNSATVTILDNEISKNIFQGILVQENSSAHIERNTISSNIKANIALGGEESCNTSIINNKIFNGRCEGIFLIDCGKCLITRNTLKGNYYGILAITSIPIVQHNEFVQNKNHAIMMLKKSRIMLDSNKIINNKGVGVFIRDDSCVHMIDCIIDGNFIGIVQERKFNPRKHAIGKKRQDDPLDFKEFDISSNLALKSSKRKKDEESEGLTDKQAQELNKWGMTDLEKTNKINDKVRIPFEVKCNLI